MSNCWRSRLVHAASTTRPDMETATTDPHCHQLSGYATAALAAHSAHPTRTAQRLTEKHSNCQGEKEKKGMRVGTRELIVPKIEYAKAWEQAEGRRWRARHAVRV